MDEIQPRLVCGIFFSRFCVKRAGKLLPASSLGRFAEVKGSIARFGMQSRLGRFHVSDSSIVLPRPSNACHQSPIAEANTACAIAFFVSCLGRGRRRLLGNGAWKEQERMRREVYYVPAAVLYYYFELQE